MAPLQVEIMSLSGAYILVHTCTYLYVLCRAVERWQSRAGKGSTSICIRTDHSFLLEGRPVKSQKLEEAKSVLGGSRCRSLDRVPWRAETRH